MTEGSSPVLSPTSSQTQENSVDDVEANPSCVENITKNIGATVTTVVTSSTAIKQEPVDFDNDENYQISFQSHYDSFNSSDLNTGLVRNRHKRCIVDSKLPLIKLSQIKSVYDNRNSAGSTTIRQMFALKKRLKQEPLNGGTDNWLSQKTKSKDLQGDFAVDMHRQADNSDSPSSEAEFPKVIIIIFQFILYLLLLQYYVFSFQNLLLATLVLLQGKYLIGFTIAMMFFITR